MAKKASSKCRNSSASTSTSTSLSRTATKRVKSAEKVKAGGVKQSKPTSKKKPKKPPTAFFYFLEDFRKEFQEQNPDVRSMRDIGKACGEKWKIMTYEEKVHYYDIATEKRREFDRAMTYFNKKKEGGEFQEYEEDSDFDE
ncbi:high mobility group B protein 14 isoform X4 [Solanum tuberosum]|uniref:high mobility group B protein 14 isoform X4 n=1 Tax=Solanum tuberosum TaxID=4113 RepID=UPI0003D26AAA|nr:PREDICTED: high mobility group B protein 14 isoform X4 [Solanum tuberosum]